MLSLRRWTRRLTRTAAVAAVFFATTSMAPLSAEPATPDPITRLREGNERFVKGANATVPLNAATRQTLMKEQHPFAMILSCADSRVPPEFVFNVGLGDLFVVRAAGEVTDHSVLASLEYGAEHLHVPVLVVMGHESCGAVKAASEAEHGDSPNLDYLVTHIRAGFHHTAAEQKELRVAILDNVEQVINDTLAGSEVLRSAVDAGHLQVVGAYYELASGRVIFSAPVGSPTGRH